MGSASSVASKSSPKKSLSPLKTAASPITEKSPSKNKTFNAPTKEESNMNEIHRLPSKKYSQIFVQTFSFSSKKGSGNLQVTDLEDGELFHPVADESNCSTNMGTNSSNLLSPNHSLGNILSANSSEDDHDEENASLAFNPIAATRELCELVKNEPAARELFARFVKENAMKWLEQIATQSQSKSNGNIVSPPSSPIASHSKSTPASPKESNQSNAQYFSSTTINFHSYTVTKAMLFNQSNNNQNYESETNTREKSDLDFVNLMKQLKIKDSIQANSLYANSRSFDSNDATIVAHNNSSTLTVTAATATGEPSLSAKSACTNGKSPYLLERLFPREVLEAYLFSVLLPLFASSSQFQTLKAKNFSSEALSRLSYTSNTSQMQDFRIAGIIQQTRSQLKNESLANIQQLFFSLSKEITADRINSALSSSAWLNLIPASLADCPFGIAYCRNNATAAAESHNDSASYLKEQLPLVYTNKAMTSITGYEKAELAGKNLSSLLPKKDQKILVFPRPPSQQKQGPIDYYNDKRLVHKFLDYNQKGDRCKVGIIVEKKNQEKMYDFISTTPIFKSDRHQQQQHQFLLSLHYDMNDEEAKISDLKIMEDLQCLLFLLSY